MVLTLVPQQPGPAASTLKRVGTGPQCIPMKTLQSRVCLGALSNTVGSAEGAVGRRRQPENRAGLVAVSIASVSLGITSANGEGRETGSGYTGSHRNDNVAPVTSAWKKESKKNPTKNKTWDKASDVWFPLKKSIEPVCTN